jgi:molybdopterin-containing oxidoreductase family iron-sulfur binding subunit
VTAEKPLQLKIRLICDVAGAGCKKAEDRGEIVPYLKQPEAAPPGIPLYYASCLLQRPSAPAVPVTSREGRPVKLGGNPDHPLSRGALGAYGQAATLELYDPDRLKAPTHQGKAIAWETADTEITRALNQAARAGKRILLFTPSLASPTARALINEFKTCYSTTIHLPVEMFHTGEIVEGRRRAFGSGSVPHIDWERAEWHRHKSWLAPSRKSQPAPWQC